MLKILFNSVITEGISQCYSSFRRKSEEQIHYRSGRRKSMYKGGKTDFLQRGRGKSIEPPPDRIEFVCLQTRIFFSSLSVTRNTQSSKK